MSDQKQNGSGISILRAIGPAIIIASVVVGPGSILTSSRVGTDFGYGMIWVLAISGLLMMGMTALSARLGVTLDGTLCEELARRAGRSVAMITGVSLFLIAACFQFGNNLGVLAAIEPLVSVAEVAVENATHISEAEVSVPREQLFTWPVILLVLLNVAIITTLLGFQNLYKPIERLMMILVGLMLIGFAGNLIFAKPSLLDVLGGLRPQFPDDAASSIIPHKVGDDIVDKLLPVVGLIGTTFSVAGAFYHSYLVRKKGWTVSDLRQGFVDSVVGISILGLITLMIMVTAAAVLHGNIAGKDLGSAADVARQLEPLFGPSAKILFCMGLFAGAFSSFLVNAMIGGSILSDGLGLGGDMDGRWPKTFTIVALLMGMMVAIYVKATGQRPVNLIIFAQALTVLGIPILAAAMLWLATRSDMTGERQVPTWMKAVGAVGLAVAIFLALRTAVRLYLSLT